MTENNERNKEDLSDIYRAIQSPAMRLIVQLLAIHVFPMRQKDLIYCLDEMSQRDDSGNRFNARSVQQTVKVLEQSGVVIKSSSGICCNDRIRVHAVTQVVLDKNFSYYADILEGLMHFETAVRKMAGGDARGLYRSLQISLFDYDDPEMISSVWNEAQIDIPYEFRKKPPLLSFLNQPFNPLLFKTLGPETQAHTMSIMFAETDLVLSDCRQLSKYAFEFYCSQQGMVKQKGRFLEFLFLCARFDEYDAVLKTLPEDCYEFMVFQGLRSLVYNEQTALTWFNNALSILKKQTRKRKIFLPGIAGLMLLFALLRTKEPGCYQIALAHIKTALNNQDIYSILIYSIKPLFEMFSAKESDCDTQSDIYDSIEIKNYKIRFFIILIRAWRSRDKAIGYADQLKQIQKKAAQAGYLWLAAESAMLLAETGNDPKTNSEYAQSVHASQGTTSLVNMVTPIPAWEKILSALTHIGQSAGTGSQDSAANADQRLIWLLHHYKQTKRADITPRLQKLTKKKTWTKGRAVALKNLYENFRSMDFLTDQDKKVCQAIKEYSFRSGYSSGYYNLYPD